MWNAPESITSAGRARSSVSCRKWPICKFVKFIPIDWHVALSAWRWARGRELGLGVGWGSWLEVGAGSYKGVGRVKRDNLGWKDEDKKDDNRVPVDQPILALITSNRQRYLLTGQLLLGMSRQLFPCSVFVYYKRYDHIFLYTHHTLNVSQTFHVLNWSLSSPKGQVTVLSFKFIKQRWIDMVTIMDFSLAVPILTKKPIILAPSILDLTQSIALPLSLPTVLMNYICSYFDIWRTQFKKVVRILEI